MNRFTWPPRNTVESNADDARFGEVLIHWEVGDGGITRVQTHIGKSPENNFSSKVPLTWCFFGTTFVVPLSPRTKSIAVRFVVAINILKHPKDSLEDRWARLRTHKRVISQVKFRVEWEEDAQRQSANAVTVDVSHSGCMAIVGAPLPLHKQVRLIHPQTGRKAEAQVVWRDHEAWDTGFELVKPDASFWGVRF